MKRTLLLMVVSALLLTQCRKPSIEFPTAEQAVTVSMTITAGPGSKTDISTTGGITWSSGDMIYVGYDGKNVGSLTLTEGAGSSRGTFTGTVTLTGVTDGDPCEFKFFYLGTEPTMVGTTTATVSFAVQDIYAEDGKLTNASKFHVGYGTATGKVSDGVISGINVTMKSKVAIAYFSFSNGANPYKGALTLSGANIYNSMTVGFDGTFTGTKTVDGSITLASGHAERYVMLVPSGSTIDERLLFTGGAEGETIIANGIAANKFYRMPDGSAIEVTVQKPAYIPAYFSVAPGKVVKFSRGNLYYNAGWHFEANQYDFRTLSTYPRCIDGVYGASSGTDVGRGIFGWSTDGPGCNWGMYYSSTEIGGNFVEWGQNSIDGVTGCRTLTCCDDPKGEWDYLMTVRTGKYNNTDASAADLFGYATITVSGGSVKGLVLLPDTFVLPDGASFVSSATTVFTANQYTTEQWSKMEEAGAVFLPCTGYYNQTYGGGSYQEQQTRYWSRTKYYNPYSPSNVYAQNLLIQDSGASVGFAKVCNCYAVRLVVDVPPTESDGNGAPDYTQGTW